MRPMAAARLPFVCSRLLATARSSGRPSAVARKNYGFSDASRCKGSFAPRSGKGVEPMAWEKQQQQQQQQQGQGQSREEQDPAESKGIADPPSQLNAAQSEKAPAVKQDHTPTQTTSTSTENMIASSDQKGSPQEEPKPEAEKLSYATEFEATEPQETTTIGSDVDELSRSVAAENEAGEKRAQQAKEEARQSGPLEAVLHMEPPEGDKQGQQQQPSMRPPPYVHHFDSYSLVKQLQEGGYTQDQAITAMKGVRTLLAQHLDVAQENLVSKSDIENETYLFSAACSELRAEVKNNRRLSDEQTRQQRTHLQHEVDILTQSLNQQSHGLNDMVRGMFNDRKMAVNEEQKKIESAIQQISYKISITLSSDARSEIEGIRGILIRRSVLGLIFMVVITLGTLQYATYVSDQRKKDEDRRRAQEEELRRDGGKTDHTTAVDAAALLAAN